MGILLEQANLPSGISVSNVYMSFSGEVIYVVPNLGSNNYNINTHYKIFRDQSKQLDANIRIPIHVEVTDISVGVYHYLYEKLKSYYPDSIDVIEPEPEVIIPDVVAEIL
jgi:hypothetical protein